MQSYVDYNENDCPWYYFDNSYKTLLGACLIVFGMDCFIYSYSLVLYQISQRNINNDQW